MESLISIFRIDVKLFIAQLINFALVFFVLYRFAFKPLIATMAERSAKIDKSLKDAEEIEKRLAATGQESKNIIVAAKKEAIAILKEAEKRGEVKKSEFVLKAKEEVGQIINSEKAKLAKEKAETLKEIKKEVSDLVIMSSEKLLNQNVDGTHDQKMVKKSLK